MKLLTFQSTDDLKLGILTENGVLDVQKAANTLGFHEAPHNPAELFQAGNDALSALKVLTEKALETAFFYEESQLQLGPCVPDPGKILCVGLNYRKHAAESGMAEPTTPVLFSKFNNTIAAPGEGVPLPSVGEQYDYEAELVVVIGKQAKNVGEDEALDYVLGYCNGNDISCRDLQMLTGQWLLGKTLDKFMPVGPYLVTADEAGDPQDMTVTCTFNGELRQNSNTADMIFSVREIISYASKHMTLNPGDIITTGTPEGVILGMDPKVWMKPGDTTIIEIGDLGRLENQMVESQS